MGGGKDAPNFPSLSITKLLTFGDIAKEGSRSSYAPISLSTTYVAKTESLVRNNYNNSCVQMSYPRALVVHWFRLDPAHD